MSIRTLLVFAGMAATAVQAQPRSGYYRFPALYDDTIVFTAEGDLWRVGSSGGAAARLTSHPGIESNAAISGGGKWLAFSAQYEGPTEVYVMPLAGGLPQRLTYEGEKAQVRGWTRDGRVLYSTAHYSTLPDDQLVAIDPATLQRSFVPLAQAADGAYDDSGRVLYFTRYSFQGSHDKRYAGGTAQSIWRYDDQGSEAVPMTSDYLGTSCSPMWWQGRVYFASDRDGTMNLWSMKPDGADPRQHTRHADFGIKNPSLNAGRVVYQNGADLWIYDISKAEARLVPITLTSDFDQMRERWIAKPIEMLPKETLSSFEMSPDGDRIALTVRGQIFIAPVVPGRLAEVAPQRGVRYREAGFMPDGKTILYLSDETGEVEFYRAPANGDGPATAVTGNGRNTKVRGFPSPDSKWIAFTQRDETLLLYNIETREMRTVASSPFGNFTAPQVAWSPDSQWFAYTNSVGNMNDVVFLYGLASRQSTEVTSERVNSGEPAFSRDGKWLYFLSNRSFHSAVSEPWGSYQPEPFFEKPTKIYQVALGAETHSPFQAVDELLEASDGKSAATGIEAMDASGKAAFSTESPAGPLKVEPPHSVVVTVDGLASRLWEVPVPAGRYHDLHVTEKVLYLLDAGLPDDKNEIHNRLVAIEIRRKSPEAVVLRPDVKMLRVSSNGEKLLFKEKEDLFVTDAVTQPIANLDQAKVNLDALKVSIWPKKDWQELFVDAWRMHRDYFYDKNMHGVDWVGARAKYQPLAERVTDREELDDVLGYMISELSALHADVRDTDIRKGADDVKVASLGARWSWDERARGYRLEHIYQADPDYPAMLSPLRHAGMGIKDGDIVLEINGVETRLVPDAGALLRNQAGLQVLIKLRSGAGEPFERVVVPMDPDQERSLRYADWELSRRQLVDRAADGKIGYVHLRTMWEPDFEKFAQDYYPVLNRPALILDLRHNRGGNIDSWLLSRLMRRDWMWWGPRDGQPVPDLQFAAPAHLAVLVDAWTFSDGETMANGIRHLGLGKILGMRTCGGGIWLSRDNRLADYGVASAGESGTYIRGEGWTVEGVGVRPDQIIDNPPAAAFQGQDAQLDAAIRLLQAEIADEPHPTPPPPPYPDKNFHPANNGKKKEG